ncbi:MAG: type II secretion system F family protein [Pseudomonadota bacterium]
MFGIDIIYIAFIGLIAVTVGLIGYAVMYNSIASEKKTSERMKSFQVDAKTKAKVQSKRQDEKSRRKAREETLKSLDSQRASGKKAAKPSLAGLLTQAGMTISVRNFYFVSAGVGVLFAFMALILGKMPFLVSIGIGFVMGFGAPRWFVGFKRTKRFNKFGHAFPGAIDIIVRGVRSGLPLNDCLRVIANDADEPVRSEFRKLVEATQMGITVPDACERLYESVPTSETNFFSIVIAIQSQAGGNLSEALGNLSKVLRERRKMSDKIKAVSTEAKTSAIIIGALPFVVAGMVWFTSPDYLDPLFYTTSGHKVLAVCALMMVGGIAIMRKMINFKF